LYVVLLYGTEHVPSNELHKMCFIFKLTLFLFLSIGRCCERKKHSDNLNDVSFINKIMSLISDGPF